MDFTQMNTRQAKVHSFRPIQYLGVCYSNPAQIDKYIWTEMISAPNMLRIQFGVQNKS